METHPLQIIKSDQIEQIAEALALAQGEMLIPQKKRTATVQMKAEKGGGSYTYQYADLSDIRAAITPALSKHGLALTQLIDADSVRLTTLLLHKSGQLLGCTYDLPRGLPAQQFGSALTYARRYSACALTGVVAEDDDDASAGQGYTERNAKNAKRAGTAIKPPPVQANPTQGGTSGPKLAGPPRGTSRADINAKLRAATVSLMQLIPNTDPTSMVYERYGAQKPSDMNDGEAWDFLNHVESMLQKGVAQ